MHVRLDKWLWAARFYKTRTLAAAAVNGGRVRLNGARVKAAHALRVGDALTIARGAEHWEIAVRGLTVKRVSASSAQLLYEESAYSRELRAHHAELCKLAALTSPAPAKRPDKKSRRLIHRFKQGL